MDLLVMRDYFMQCRLAREAQLLQQLNQLLHFKDDALCYSIVDLAAVQDGSLLPRLQDAHREYSNHIKEECPVSWLIHEYFNWQCMICLSPPLSAVLWQRVPV